ncbi:tetratricopeptide repeat protein [Myxococcota bacterium]|nr:tetratricopeptide repeat protein [Myxococcota bacterium]MBU1432656.1 tetratricopeptide repeat protein [Myxococcota bacterium]MBU1897715.1 tetratricopeptide repeat protein [Myxococcota bacterium]
MEHSIETRRQLKEAVDALEARHLGECHRLLDALNPQLPSVIALRGLAYAQAGALKQGIEALSTGLLTHPKNRPLRLHLAALLEQAEDPQAALEVIESASLEGQGAFALYARCLFKVGRVEQAEAICQRARAQHPQDPDLLEIHARLMLHREAAEEALALLERIDASAPLPLRRLQAEALRGAGHWGQARVCYEALHRDAPEDAEVLGGLAATLEAQGALLMAYGYALRATINAPEAPWLHHLHARLGLRLGRYEAAMGAAASSVTLQPESAPALRLAVRVARARGRYVEARPFAQRLLLLQPKDPEARAILAILACLEGDQGVAQRLIGPVKRLEDPDLLIAYACARLLAGATAEGLKALKRAARQRLDDPLIQDLLGVAYQPEGDPRFAIRAALEQARGEEAGLRLEPLGFAPQQLDIPQPAGPALSAALSKLLGEGAPLGDKPSLSIPPEARPSESIEGAHTFDLGWREENDPPLQMRLPDEEISVGDAPIDALRRLLHEPLFADLLGQLEHAHAHLDEPLLLAILGPDGAGKTSVVNALVGQPVIPLQTRWPHLLKYGRQPSGRVVLHDGERVKRPLTDLHQLPAHTRARLVEILLPLEELTHVSLLDLPTSAEDEALLDEVDGFLWVIGADQPPALWAEAPGWIEDRPALAICNSKGLPPADLKAVEAQIRGRIGEGVMLITLDARRALDALTARDAQAFRASGLPRLRRGLEKVFFSQAEKLRLAALRRRLAEIRARAVARVEARKLEIEGRIDALAALSIALQTAPVTSSEIWAGLLTTLEGLRDGEEGQLMATIISARISSRAKLEAISQRSISVLQEIFPSEEAPTEAARVLGLAALLESHKEMLLEQSFGRGEAYLRGYHTQRPTTPPDLSHFLPRAVPLEAVIQRFIEEAITELRLALLKLEKRYEEPLRRDD